MFHGTIQNVGIRFLVEICRLISYEGALNS